MYWSLTTKGLKKKHSSRPVGGVEMGHWGREDVWQGCSSWTEGSHICMWINQRNNWGAWQTKQPRVPVQGNKASKPLTVKTCGGYSSGRTSQTPRRVCWRDPQGPRRYTNPPTLESAPEEPNLLLDIRGSDWKPVGSWASGIISSWTLPPHTEPLRIHVDCPALVNA